MCANVAQSAEQLIRNQQVAGSIPAVSSKEKIERAEELRTESYKRPVDFEGDPKNSEDFRGEGALLRKVRFGLKRQIEKKGRSATLSRVRFVAQLHREDRASGRVKKQNHTSEGELKYTLAKLDELDEIFDLYRYVIKTTDTWDWSDFC